jgi:zinc transport system substrate-binding protein
MQKITPSFLLKLSIFCFSMLFLPPHAAHALETKIKVVASINPLADFVRQVGGSKVEVVLLLPPGASPHTYEPTPKVIREISQSRIFLK